MGHVYAYTWAIYGGIYRVYIVIYGGSLIGRVGRKGIVGNPFPSLVIPAPSLPLPSLPCSVAYLALYPITSGLAFSSNYST